MRYLLCLLLVLSVSCSCPEPEEAPEPTLEELIGNRLDDLYAERQELLSLPFERRSITSVEVAEETELACELFDEGEWRRDGDGLQQTFETQAQAGGDVLVVLKWEHASDVDTQLLIYVGGTQISTGTLTSTTSLECLIYDPRSRLIHITIVRANNLASDYELTVTERAD